MPKRIQRKRTKGWRMPENAVYVGRPTEWGNPFIVGKHGTVEECVEMYRKVFLSDYKPGELTKEQLRAANEMWPDAFSMPDQMTAKIFLKGKDLACWCQLDQPCHADVLLKLANEKNHAA